MEMLIFGIIILAVFLGWKMYVFYYFNSVSFLLLKKRIEKLVDNYNQLNFYIRKLRNAYSILQKTDYGYSDYRDSSTYHYSRPKQNEFVRYPNVYNCSSVVLNNSRNQPFKYLCKYFNIKTTEESLQKFEKILNDFESAEAGKVKLVNEKNAILRSISNEIPYLIRKFKSDRVEKELGFQTFNYYDYFFPKYVFQYVSAGGYSSSSNEIVLDIPNLNRFIQYLSEIVVFRKSAQGQRALMTSGLRKYILQRDNYTCKNCGNSTRKEPNLLLEVDHIIPISRGGYTTHENLQTLCWKCNRAKGAKVGLGVVVDKVNTNKRFCGFCGSEEIDGDGYCNRCGMDNKGVNKQSQTSELCAEEAVVTKSVEYDKSVREIESVQNTFITNKQVCCFCGADEIDSYGYCDHCGMDNKGVNKHSMVLVSTEETKEILPVMNSICEDQPSINEVGNQVEDIIKEESKEEKTMYDKERGIYPAGQYLVGRDLPLGSYLLVAKKDQSACVELYPSYAKYKKEEDAIVFETFSEDYHIPLMEENTFFVVANASIQKV